MATGRIINKIISTSEKVADLSLAAQLLYTWLIPHTDDLGLIQATTRTIKATVVPMNDNFTTETVETCIKEMIDCELLKKVTFEQKEYLYVSGFTENQTFKRDRQPQTVLSIKKQKNAKETWKLCEQVVNNFPGIQMDPNGIQMVPEMKGNEMKGKEKKLNNEQKTSAEVSEVEKPDDYLQLATMGSAQLKTEWQSTAFEIIKALKILPQRKSAFFKACKLEKQSHVEAAFSFASDYPNPSMKDKMFFWKLSELKKATNAQ